MIYLKKFTGEQLGSSFQVCPVFWVMTSLVFSTLILIVFGGLIVEPFWQGHPSPLWLHFKACSHPLALVLGPSWLWWKYRCVLLMAAWHRYGSLFQKLLLLLISSTLVRQGAQLLVSASRNVLAIIWRSFSSCVLPWVLCRCIMLCWVCLSILGDLGNHLKDKYIPFFK